MLFAVEDVSAANVLMGVLTIVVGSMGTALGILWRRVEANYQECREDRAKLYDRLLAMAPLGCADRECHDRQPLPMAKLSMSNSGRRDLEGRA